MSFEPNDDLLRAKASLTIARLCEYAGRALQEGRDGKFFSPLRDEKTASFSVTKEGKVWADFGGGPADKGGCWELAEKFWPSASKGEIAKHIIEASGIIATPPRMTEPAAAGAPGAAAPVDPALKKAAADLERKRKLREAEERPYLERDTWLVRPEMKPALPWPACARDRWLEGVRYLKENLKRVAEIAKERGWPASWAQGLVDMDLLSFPLERRFDPGAVNGRRQKAFRVDGPVFAKSFARVALDPLGYHQRYFIPARDNEPAQKGWVFAPSVPKYRPQSEYERELVAYGAAHGSTPATPSPLVPPLPFVLGDLGETRVLVLLEGQWDAASFFGACGWFFDDDQVEHLPATGCAVMGIRGAQGVDPFLAHWWNWLKAVKPLCWVIADNDSAGGTWREAPAAAPGKIRMPSFADRLKAAGCRDVLVSWLDPEGYGPDLERKQKKDFNDYVRYCAAVDAPIGPEAMRAWMRDVGVLTVEGKFA